MEDHTAQKTDSKTDLLQLVTFFLGDEEYAADILNIQGINRMVEVTKVPNTPEFVEGIINLRGKVIPLIDLRKKLGMEEVERDKNSRFIVVELGDNVTGFIVDSVNEVLRINREITEPPPQSLSSINSEYITSVAKVDERLIILLDLQRVLSNKEINEIEKINDDNN
mgnify:CR=1 FL=1